MTGHHELIAAMMGDDGVVIPTPTWSWNFSNNIDSIPAGNSGANGGAAFVNDSSGNPNEALQFIASQNDWVLFNSVNFGGSNFSIYKQFIKTGDGDANNDTLSNHIGGAGWTMEQGPSTAKTYRFVGWDGSGFFQTNTFTIPLATLIKMFIVRSGSNLSVLINDVQVASLSGLGTIVDYNGGMAMSGLPSVLNTHNADITVDGFRIWKGTALTAAEQTAQLAQGI